MILSMCIILKQCYDYDTNFASGIFNVKQILFLNVRSVFKLIHDWKEVGISIQNNIYNPESLSINQFTLHSLSNYTVCGPVQTIDSGSIALQDTGNNSYRALANVTCEKGFNASLDTIKCLDTGKWENTSCDIVGM